MQASFRLSVDDQAELNKYDADIQQRIHMLLDCFERITKSNLKVVDACLHEAHVMGNKKPFTCGSIKRLYYTFIKSGDFRELIDKRLDKVEEDATYFKGGVRYASAAAAVVIAILGWGLKSQLDTLQTLPVKLDRIERQQAEEVKIDDLLTAEIQRLKEASHAAP